MTSVDSGIARVSNPQVYRMYYQAEAQATVKSADLLVTVEWHSIHKPDMVLQH